MPPSKVESLFIIPSNDNRTTFGEDEKLPSLPLPDLKHTLSRYLDSLKPFLTSQEFTKSLKLIKEFEDGVGKKLHAKLKKKAETERNWVEKWWEDVAYLQIRSPLIPFCSMDGVLPKNIPHWSFGSEYDQIKHAALFGHYLTKFWTMLRRKTLLPTTTIDKKTTFSMTQYRRLFNTVRIPGEKIDSLVSYFKTASEGRCSSVVIVMCNGRFFAVNGVDSEENSISSSQWEDVLRRVISKCNESDEFSSIGVLSCDERSNWSKNRKHLENISNRNKEILDIIDQSLFVLVLDNESPETDSDVTRCNLCGVYENRWCDKSMSMIFYKNGRSGCICDHTAFDGIISISCHHYVLTAIEEEAMSNIDKRKMEEFSSPEFKELVFDLDEELKREINKVKADTSKFKKEVLMTRRVFEDYGKLEIQKLKFHPDSYIQMCLQLAYFELHQKPAPCYETATTRKFYNGRTETLRCCTTQCIDWVISMCDSQFTNNERKALLEKAIKRHDQLMKEARENSGCDRHLFGLYCTAVEEGIEIPELYSDPGYFKSGGGGNFVLSTSCVGYSPLGGGVAPMCVNGYGIFYNILPDKLYFTISVNTNSTETNPEKFFESLKKSLRRTRHILLSVGSSKI